MNYWTMSLLLLLVVMATAALATWIAVIFPLRRLRRLRSTHWTEQARVAYPGRSLLYQCSLFLPLVLAITFGDDPWLRFLPPLFRFLLLYFAGWLGVGWMASRSLSVIYQRPISLAAWAREWLVLVLLFYPMFPCFVLMQSGFSNRFDFYFFLSLIGTIIVVFLFSAGGSILFARVFGLLQPPSPCLVKIVEQAAQARQLQPRALYVLRWYQSNALAFPFDQSIAFTEGILLSLTDEELTTIAAHEIAHLQEPRKVMYARLASNYIMLPIFLLGPLTQHWGAAAAAVVFTSVALGFLAYRTLQRNAEINADAAGQSSEQTEGDYARALESIYRASLAPAVMRQKKLPHPHLYDRLLAAKVTPDYPRPKPPSPAFAMIGFVSIVVSVVAGFCFWNRLADFFFS